jgi:hypothetical protein
MRVHFKLRLGNLNDVPEMSPKSQEFSSVRLVHHDTTFPQRSFRPKRNSIVSMRPGGQAFMADEAIQRSTNMRKETNANETHMSACLGKLMKHAY